MITGAAPKVMARLRRLRTHAMSLSAAERHRALRVMFEEYPEVGYNYRLTDIQAAVGREQLKRLPQLVAGRRRLAARYREALSGHPCLAFPQEPAYRNLSLPFPLPVSERLQDRSIILPLYPGMTDPEQERVVAALEAVLR